MVEMWKEKHAQLEGKTGGKKLWEEVEISEPLPYLPGNPEYGEEVKAIVHCYRVL